MAETLKSYLINIGFKVDQNAVVKKPARVGRIMMRDVVPPCRPLAGRIWTACAILARTLPRMAVATTLIVLAVTSLNYVALSTPKNYA